MGYGGGILLLAAVAGYWVLERAQTHKGTLKQVGQLLGWVIIVTSLIGMACRVWALATGKAYCPAKKGWSYPYMQKSFTPPPSPPQ